MPLLNFLFPPTAYFSFHFRTFASFFLSFPFSSFGHSLFKPVSYICEKKFFSTIVLACYSQRLIAYVLTAVRNFCCWKHTLQAHLVSLTHPLWFFFIRNCHFDWTQLCEVVGYGRSIHEGILSCLLVNTCLLVISCCLCVILHRLPTACSDAWSNIPQGFTINVAE